MYSEELTYGTVDQSYGAVHKMCDRDFGIGGVVGTRTKHYHFIITKKGKESIEFMFKIYMRVG